MKSIKTRYEKIFPYYEKEKKYKFNNTLNTVNGVEMILMTFGTLLLFYYELYLYLFAIYIKWSDYFLLFKIYDG